MGSSTDGSGEARGAPSSEDSDENGQRGLLGRLIDALSPAETGSSGSAPPQDIPPAGMLPGVGNLRTLHVDDVAVPKAEIVAVPVTIDRDSLADVFREHGFSRLPVYQDTLDRPLGLVMLKDFALTCGFGADPEGFDLQPMLRPALYVPPSMPLAVLLQKMRTERVHMALMIDEYGGVDGLVTIEDLIETVVGDIADEHDAEEDAMWVEEAPGVFLVQSRAPLDEFEAAIGMRLHDDGD
ncbi:MAG: CBS domain-containing protein, partial [Gemmobacter sp.]